MSRQLVLTRYHYGDDLTEGRLHVGKQVLRTLERPWRAGMPGGMPFESCVPDGEYELLRHTRPSGDAVLALRNPDLHVYYTKEERGAASGRYLILIHSANYVEQVAGCIAPGLSRTIADNRVMVRSSREAMAKIMAARWDSILIQPGCGTGAG